MTVALPRPQAVVLDIEGTVSSTRFVHETLYPFSRARFAEYLGEHSDNPDVQRARAQIIELGGLAADASVEDLVAQLEAWLAADEKRTPLKTLQGLIWSDGYAAGELTTHFFEDSLPVLKKWHAAGVPLYIFSSGSVAAQKSWYSNSPDGDVLYLISGHFDTENAGPKKEAASYETIAREIGVEPGGIVFFSDLLAELDAARAAGWRTVGVRREGDQYFEAGVGDHDAVFTFDEVAIEGVPADTEL